MHSYVTLNSYRSGPCEHSVSVLCSRLQMWVSVGSLNFYFNIIVMNSWFLELFLTDKQTDRQADRQTSRKPSQTPPNNLPKNPVPCLSVGRSICLSVVCLSVCRLSVSVCLSVCLSFFSCFAIFAINFLSSLFSGRVPMLVLWARQELYPACIITFRTLAARTVNYFHN